MPAPVFGSGLLPCPPKRRMTMIFVSLCLSLIERFEASALLNMLFSVNCILASIVLARLL